MGVLHCALYSQSLLNDFIRVNLRPSAVTIPCLFASIRGYYSRLRNVNELINSSLDSDALLRLRIAIPKNLLFTNEYAVCAALCCHCPNLRPGVTGHGFQSILNCNHSKPSERRLGSGS